MSDDSIFRFGAFELDTRSRQLRKHTVRIKLYGQSLDILTLLVERPGEVITRGEMRNRIWPQGTFVDFEQSLNSAVRNLRRTLSDSAERPTFIETIPRLGYRFLVPVDKVQPGAASNVALIADVAPTAPREAVRSPESRSRLISTWTRWRLEIAAALILAVSAGVYARWLRPSARPEAQAGRVMVAVLPFQNLTGDVAQDYFSDGFTEEIIAKLGPLDPDRIGVIARTSAMYYKNSSAPLSQIGRQLGVGYVLEGAVLRQGNHVRVSADLVRVDDQTRLWSHQYDRELNDSLMLQDEVAREISDELEMNLERGSAMKLARSTASAPPASAEAFELYLRGRYFWNQRTTEGLRQAAGYFRGAINLDPNFARAYAGLADTYTMMCAWNLVPKDEFVPEARAAALKALQLDDTLAEAHTSLALIVENYDWDWPAAEKEYRRAIELDPAYATAHQWYAEYLTWEGRFDDAAQESERARKLDPLSLIIAADRGAMLYYARRYPESIAQFRSVLDMNAGFPRANFVVFPYLQSAMYPEALASADKLDREVGESDWVLSQIAYADAKAGRVEVARLALGRLQQISRRESIDPQLFVLPYVGLDDKQKALDSLEKACAMHSNLMTSLKVEPAFDPLRDEPRFQNLMRRVGFAQ